MNVSDEATAEAFSMKDGREENREKGKRGAKHVAMLALLVALSLVVHVVESLLPPMGVPGAKPGLANVFSLFALVLYGPADALVVVLARTLLGALVTGTVSALPYSLAAGVVSTALSALLLCPPFMRVSVMATSVASAVVHNLTQNAVFALVSGTPLALGYSPYLALIALPCGAFVGFLVWFVVRKLPITLLTGVM